MVNELPKLVLNRPENIIGIDKEKLVSLKGVIDVSMEGMSQSVSIRSSGPFQDHALFLDNAYVWILGVDELGVTVLVPLKR